jgi:hypothetical protein
MLRMDNEQLPSITEALEPTMVHMSAGDDEIPSGVDKAIAFAKAFITKTAYMIENLSFRENIRSSMCEGLFQTRLQVTHRYDTNKRLSLRSSTQSAVAWENHMRSAITRHIYQHFDILLSRRVHNTLVQDINALWPERNADVRKTQRDLRTVIRKYRLASYRNRIFLARMGFAEYVLLPVARRRTPRDI